MAKSDAKHLYDMFIVGLCLLNNESPGKPQLGTSVLHTMFIAKMVTKGQWLSAGTNTKLISYALPTTKVIRASRRPHKNTIDELARSIRELTIVVTKDNQLVYSKLFGPRGYQHVITDAGISHAMAVTGIPSQSAFNAAWLQHTRQMHAMNAKEGIN